VLLLPEHERQELWQALIEAIERYQTTVDEGRVTPVMDPEPIRAALAPLDFSRPMNHLLALDFMVQGLGRFQTHTPHRMYYGLFNPAPTTMSIAADALVAAFNPQLAAWSHSPLAIEIEQHLARMLGGLFGYDPEKTEGVFASGGAEANHTAVLTALANAFPEFGSDGIGSLPGRPTLYVSAESHHSFLKAARLCGLGTGAVREVPIDEELRMIPDELRSAIAADRADGHLPFLVAGTAGTTGAGTFDPLPRLAAIAHEEDLWFHIDAAWGGGAALVPELRSVLEGIERGDSITFDAHKLLSVPMGAGLYLTQRPGILERTFSVAAGYMPREARGLAVTDPYSVSMQWSRRFTGLKVFMSLLVAGWDGYADAIRHQVAMGKELREKLSAARWDPVTDSPLPVVCFVDGRAGGAGNHLARILSEVLESGEAWISITELPHRGPVLRACITNYRTGPDDLDRLVGALNRARDRAGKSSS
jgi:glutamate/tyrosine decarboxylase-like PLP-dependent enzyme